MHRVARCRPQPACVKSFSMATITHLCRIEQNRRRLIELGIPAAVAGLNNAVAQDKYASNFPAAHSGCRAALKCDAEALLHLHL